MHDEWVASDAASASLNALRRLSTFAAASASHPSASAATQIPGACSDLPYVHPLRDHRVGGMVVDRLEVLALYHVSPEAWIGGQLCRHVAHPVLDELRVVVGVLGDELLVRALAKSIELGRRHA